MTLLVVGFGLTAGIGGWIQDRQHSSEEARSETLNAMLAIERIVESNSAYLLRANIANDFLEDSLGSRTDPEKSNEYFEKSSDSDRAFEKVNSDLIIEGFTIERAFSDSSGKADPDGKVANLLQAISVRLHQINTDRPRYEYLYVNNAFSKDSRTYDIAEQHMTTFKWVTGHYQDCTTLILNELRTVLADYDRRSDRNAPLSERLKRYDHGGCSVPEW
jgi:hypothetical protein